MNSVKYLNILLTVIALLLSIILINQFTSSRNHGSFGFQNVAYAQSKSESSDIIFYPVGNQEVRRLVLYDMKTGTIYDYGSDGFLENTWVIGRAGEKIQKKK
jgi:hypothetical protein